MASKKKRATKKEAAQNEAFKLVPVEAAPPPTVSEKEAFSFGGEGFSAEAINSLANAGTAADVLNLASKLDLSIGACGGVKLWFYPEVGCVLSGKILGREVRVVDGREKAEFLIQVAGVADGQRILIRSSSEPKPEDGREIVKVERSGITKNYALAQPGDVIAVSESADMVQLRDRIGDFVAIKYLQIREIGRGRRFWDLAIMFITP